MLKHIFSGHTLLTTRVESGYYEYTCPITGACYHVKAHVSKDFTRRTQAIVVTINGRVVWSAEYRIGARGMRYNELPLFSGANLGADRGERILKTMIKKASA